MFDESVRRAAFLKRRLFAVHNHYGPRAAGAESEGLHDGSLVGRRLVVEHLALVPTLTSGTWRNQLQRSLGIPLISCPGARDRARSLRCLASPNRNVVVG